ncbi:hypothetical protein [Ideonella livida]|uniref:Uncharacterized protein n=1 Tax=Ideonella livida TaxID=2707176 RepID=A0A7C9THL3_9BURK|nr:hypothetical protein [Ideonella livida]NDY89764.1 hypothetical protein [Ideonella livida]
MNPQKLIAKSRAAADRHCKAAGVSNDPGQVAAARLEALERAVKAAAAELAPKTANPWVEVEDNGVVFEVSEEEDGFAVWHMGSQMSEHLDDQVIAALVRQAAAPLAALQAQGREEFAPLEAIL